MKKSLISAAAAAVVATTMTGCFEDANNGITCDGTTCTMTGTLSKDYTLDAANTYKINGTVKVEDGYTLSIPAGTTLYGATEKSYLAILPGATIDAEGTADEPIIFTSANAIDDWTTGDRGQWGGLSIFGNAQSNKGEEEYEADATITFGSDASANDTESSGTLKYVIIANTGYEVATDAELNGLSLGGVGAGTTLENIACVNGKDDAIEFWGGTVDVTNLYLKNAGDDHLDIDHGYTGTIDNCYIETADDSDRGIESDSKSVNDAGTPVSAPTLKNFTIVTSTTSTAAMRLREGINFTFENGVVDYNGDNSGANEGAYAIELRDVSDDDYNADTQATFTNVEVVTTSDKIYKSKKNTSDVEDSNGDLPSETVSTSTPSGVSVLTTASGSYGYDSSAFTWVK
jgi:hypothetical protein